MKTKITVFVLTFFLFVSTLYAQQDPDKLGGPVLIGQVAPFTLPAAIGSKKLKSDTFALRSLASTNSLEWPNPGAVHIEKTAEAVESGKWKINLMVEGKNIPKSTDVILVIDDSGSMNGTKINSAKEAAKTFVNQLLNGSTDIRIAIVTLNPASGGTTGNPQIDQVFTNNTSSLNTAIDAIVANGGTNIQGGFYAARLLVESSTADKKVVILLSDGDPTYSYNSNIAPPAFTVGCGSISNFNISRSDYENNYLKVASSIYTNVVGDGNNFNFTLFTTTCGNKTFNAGNHGIPTIYEAKKIISDGADIYTIGFEVPANGAAESTLMGSQNKGYFPANSSNISNIYSQIRSNISYAATNAVLTDPMSTFILLSANVTPTYTVLPITTGNVVVSKGSVNFSNNGFVLNDPDNPASGNSNIIKWKITWNIGTVSELGDNMYYFVTMAPNTDPTILYDANEKTFMDYTDVNGNTNAHQETPTNFTVPKVSGGKGSIEIIYYTVNDAGQPINSVGTVVTKENAVKLIPGNSKYFEINGSTALEVNQNYTVVPDINYLSNTILYNLYCNLGSIIVTPIPSDPNKKVWFGYVVNSTPKVTNVEYCINSPAVPLTATFSAGHTSPTYTLYYFDSLTGTPKTSITPLTTATGQYTYYVAEGKTTSCIGSKVPIVVSVNALPIAAIASDNGLTLSCTTPNTTLTASGGTSYLWSNGATTAAINVATAGTFSVTVKNANGCSATASVNTTLNNTLPVAAIASDNGLALSCTTPNTTLTASGGTSYLWSNGATTPAITVATAGTFSVTVKNANGCSAIASVNTTLDNTLPVAAIAYDNGLALSCNTPNTTLTASGGTSYLWSNGATTAAITVATAGTFSVTVKNTNGCSATASVNTTLDNTLPIAAIASDNGLALSCTIPNTTLTASGGTSYLWSNGATTPAITVATAGTFSVTVKNANGCWATASVTTTLDNTLPIAAIASDNGLALNCTTPNTTLTASGGTSYLWSNGATTPAITVATAGTFSVTVKNANGCSATASVNTTLDNTLPIAAIASNNGLALSCTTPNTTLTASGGRSYLWSNGATTPAITVATAGTFSVTVKNANGCSAITSVNTTLDNTLPIAAIASDNGLALSCNTPNTTLTASGGTSYLWSNGATTPAVTVSTAGTFSVTVKNANGCSATASVNTTLDNSLPLAAIASDNGLALSCNIPNTTLTASGGTSYLWSNGATTPAITVATAGTFSVTVKNANGCSAITSVNTTLDNTLPIAAIASDNGLALSCTTPNTNLTASGGTSYLWSNGATTPAITVATAGTFSVTVKNANGCSATASVNTTLDNTLPIAAIASDNGLALSCNTPNTTLTASGGTSYLWSNGATTPAITVSTAGTFSVTVKNANGCSATASVNTTLDNTLPIAAIASDNGLALSCTTPNTTLTASGGTSYLWSNGATTLAITVATAGAFSVTVKNSNGCSAITSVNTTLDNTLPIAAIASNNGLALSCTTPNTTLTASGGTSYLWSNGATTPDITVTTAGTFSVTVKNANGCSSTASVNTTLDNTLPIAAIASDNGLALSCTTPNTTLTASGGTSYLWSNGATNASITVTTAGTFSVTVKNANGCSATASVNTTLDNTLPTAAIASDNGLALSCTTPNTTLTASGGTSYLWSNGATNASITVTTAGTFSVTVKNANGCSATASVNTTLDNTLPTAAIASDNGLALSCKTPNSTLTASGGTSYLWSNGATTPAISVATAGTFSVTVKNANGCSSTASVNTTLDNTLPIAAIASDNGLALSCTTPNTTLTASGGTSYLWSNGATTPAITVTTAGTFSVTVKNANGCSATASVNTTLDNTLPIAAIASDNGLALSCKTPNTTLTASGGTSYLWSNGATTPAITVTTAGTFSVTVKNANGCSAIASVNTTLDNTLPVAAIVSDNGLALSCNIPNTTLTASGGTSYLWSNGATTPAITVATAGTFSVTVKNANGCSATASVTTTLDNSLPIAAIASDNGLALSCTTPNTTLTASGGTSYLWSNGATTPAITVATAGTFSVTVKNSNGCSSTASVTTTLDNALPIAAIASDNGLALSCNIPNTTLTASGGTSYLWSNGATTPAITVATAGTFSVTVRNSNGCSASASVNTTLDNSLPIISISSQTDAYCFGENNGTISIITEGGKSPYTYEWTKNNIAYSTSKDLIGLSQGIYKVIATSANGCSSDELKVIIQQPNAAITATAIIIDNTNCVGCSNGSITQTISGGTLPYTYLWSNGATTKDLTGLIKGNYSVEIKDKNGCVANYSYSIQESGIALVKKGIFYDSNTDGFAQAGEIINYTFIVTNTGNVTINSILITDPMKGLTIKNNSITSLNAGENATLTGIYILTQADINAGKVINSAVAIGKDPKGNEVKDISGTQQNNDTATETPLNQKASIAITKDGIYIDANKDGITNLGDKIVYSFVLINTGDVILTQVNISDNLEGLVITGSPITLQIGESNATSFSATYSITQADIDSGLVYNLATVTGTTPYNDKVTATSTDPTPCMNCVPKTDCKDCTITTLNQSANLVVYKTAAVTGYSLVGEIINYKIIVRNSGNVTLHQIVVTDPLTGLNTIISVLAPGTEQEFNESYTITKNDLDNNSVINIANAKGLTPTNAEIKASDTVEIDKAFVLGCRSIVVHNAFSPNGDGINDVFTIDDISETNCYPENTVEIYNRWGVLIFRTKNYNNQTNNFDGISQGRTTVSESTGLPSGTYFYILNYTSIDGNGTIQNNKKEGFLYLTK